MHRHLLALAGLLTLTSVVLAHEPEPGSLVSLVLDPRVQVELNLTSEQKKLLVSIRDEDQKDPAKAEVKLLGTLMRLQAKRLRELSLQVRGGSALADEGVVVDLKLTSDQKAQVERIWKNKVLDLQMREKVARFRNAVARAGWLLRNRREQGDDLILLLTEDQKKAFETMKGKPFDFNPKK